MPYLSVAVPMLLLLALLAAWGLAVAGDEASPLEALLLPPLALLGAWSAAMWITGSLGVFNAATSAAWLALFVIAGALWARRGSSLRARFKSRAASLALSLRSLGGVELACAGFVLVASVLSLALALCPPSSGDYDALVYHLSVPWQYVRAGRVLELPYDHHSYFPLGLQMQFGAVLSWFGQDLSSPNPAGGAVAARILHWAALPVSALLLVAFGARVLEDRRAGWLAAVLWCALPVALHEASTTYVDLGLCAVVLAAFHCAARAAQSLQSTPAEAARAGRWLVWAGAFAGAILNSKYLGALYVVALFVWIWGAPILSRRRGAALQEVAFPRKASLIGAALALLVGGGVYVRNVAWTGSPVFPFAYEIFGGRGWDACQARDYAADQKNFGFGRSPVDFALLPWRLSMSPLNAVADEKGRPVGLPSWPFSFEPDMDREQPHEPNAACDDPNEPTVKRNYSGIFETPGAVTSSLIGPMLLALGLPALFLRPKPAALRAWMITVGALWVFWAATGQYARYLLPAFALWCAACGWSAALLLERRALRGLVGTSLGVWCVCALLLVLGGPTRSSEWQVALGRQEPRAFVSSTFVGWEAMQWLNQNAGASDGVAVWGEPRCLYLDRRYFWADDPHNNLIDYKAIRTWPDLQRDLKRLGARWILWSTRAGEIGGFGGPSPLVVDLITRNAPLVHESGGFRVYRLE
jgi:hypothetical protein